MRDLKARDIMTSEVVWVSEEMPVSDATRMLVDEMISGAPVVDEEGAIVGVISLRDIARNDATGDRLSASENRTAFFHETWEIPISKAEAERFNIKTSSDLRVKDVMTPTLFYVEVTTPVQEVAEMMLKGRIHRVIVLENDELAGMITSMDMLSVISGAKVG